MVKRILVALYIANANAICFAADTIQVDVHDGLVFGSSRMRGMGGAFTAVAEGAGGHLFNAATMVNDPRGVVHTPVRLALDFSYAQSMIQYAFPAEQTPDESTNPSLPAYTGFVAAHVNAGVHGTGGTLQTQGFRFRTAPDEFLLLNHHQIAVGYARSLADERIMAGILADLHIGTLTRYSFAEANPSQRRLFPSAQIGVLANVGENTRVGWTLTPGFTANLNPASGEDETKLALRQPLTTAFGICHQREWDVHPDGSYRDRRSAVFAADVVYLGPSQDAFSPSHISQGYTLSSGAAPALSLRLGAETEYVPGWLRLRAGVYTEPARFVVESPRLHFTSGLQLRTFNLPKSIRWAVVGAMDLATDYVDTSIGLSFW